MTGTKTNKGDKTMTKNQEETAALSVDSMLGLGCLKGKQWKR